MNKTQALRLWGLSSILYNADRKHKMNDEPAYYQKMYVHACGTPACALGHYAMTPEARDRGWSLSNLDNLRFRGFLISYPDPQVLNEFGLTLDESFKLFGTQGCGKAKSARQASLYIRKFLKKKKRSLFGP